MALRELMLSFEEHRKHKDVYHEIQIKFAGILENYLKVCETQAFVKFVTFIKQTYIVDDRILNILVKHTQAIFEAGEILTPRQINTLFEYFNKFRSGKPATQKVINYLSE